MGAPLRRPFRSVPHTLHLPSAAAPSRSQGRGQDVNMDHHRYRAGPMANLFSNIDMGAAARPFESGGRSDRAAHTGACAG